MGQEENRRKGCGPRNSAGYSEDRQRSEGKTKEPSLCLLVTIIAFTLFCAWKAIPRTVIQIFPEFRQADSCQIIMNSITDFSDIRLEGEMLYDLLECLEKLEFYPVHRETNPYGAEVLEGNVYQVYFYKDKYLGQIAITDAGIVSDGSRHYEIRDEGAVFGWKALMRTYIEQYKEP